VAAAWRLAEEAEVAFRHGKSLIDGKEAGKPVKRVHYLE